MLAYGYRIADIVIFKQVSKGKVPSVLQKTKQKYYNTLEVDELLTLLTIRKTRCGSSMLTTDTQVRLLPMCGVKETLLLPNS